ncbi:MAG: tetratricopeptide repeat protein [Candidatus Omnitrophica bacterium]|nr:tetratricopeptide repeat protein [Candidatus Omnitrophota bacterium]
MTELSSSQLTPQIREHYEKGLAALSKGNLEYAAELLFQVVCLAPGFTEARKNLRIAQKRLLEASPKKNTGAIGKKISSAIQTFKAMLKEQKDDIAGAVTGYEQALYINPANVTALRRLAGVLKQAKMAAAAIQTFEDLLEINPDDLDAAKNLAQLYSGAGNYEKAKGYFEKVLNVSPNDQEAKKGLKDLDALGTIKKTFGDNK